MRGSAQYIDAVTICIARRSPTGDRATARSAKRLRRPFLTATAFRADAKLPPRCACLQMRCRSRWGRSAAPMPRSNGREQDLPRRDGTTSWFAGRADAQNEFDNAPDGKPAHRPVTQHAFREVGASGRGVAAPWRRPASAANSAAIPDTGLRRHRGLGRNGSGSADATRLPDHIVVSNGAQRTLLCTMIATLRKDELLVSPEHLTYPGLVGAARGSVSA